jgi:hypothetical protein
MSRRVGVDTVILVTYKPKEGVAAIATVNIIASLLGASAKVLVLNSDIRAHLEREISLDSWSIVEGSNKHHEFSGWQEGIGYLRERNVPFSGVLFANDTVGRHDRNSHLARCNLAELVLKWRNARSKQMIGIQHSVDHSMPLEGHDMSRWICTMAFCLSRKALESLEFQVDFSADAERMVSKAQDGISLLNDSTPTELKAHIEQWLLDGGWHGSKPPPLSPVDQQVLQSKARSIVAEKLLSSRVKQTGGTLVGIPELPCNGNRYVMLTPLRRRLRTAKAQLLHAIKTRFNRA